MSKTLLDSWVWLYATEGGHWGPDVYDVVLVLALPATKKRGYLKVWFTPPNASYGSLGAPSLQGLAVGGSPGIVGCSES